MKLSLEWLGQYVNLAGLLPKIPLIASDKLLSSLVEFCKKNQIKYLGIDPDKVSYALALRLKRRIKIQEKPGIIEGLRQIKDDQEIAAIRKACLIASRTARKVMKYVRPGMSEIEIALKIESLFLKEAVQSSFTPIVASGPNTALPHHLSSKRRVGRNDIVMIDIGCRYRGYCSDLTRTFFFGKINNLQKEVYRLVKRAKAEAINALRPKTKACAVDAVARGVITAGGYGGRFVHSTGHGVGIEVHEAPRISANDTTALKSGMVVTIEPGVYIPGKFGVRIEDTVVITPHGNEVLTT